MSCKKVCITGFRFLASFSIIKVKFNRRNGVSTIHNFGEIAQTMNYINGKRNGRFTHYHNNNSIICETWYYIDGLKNGYGEYYYISGHMRSKIYYTNEIKNGEVISYDYDGSINGIYYYINYRIQGLFIHYKKHKAKLSYMVDNESYEL